MYSLQNNPVRQMSSILPFCSWGWLWLAEREHLLLVLLGNVGESQDFNQKLCSSATSYNITLSTLWTKASSCNTGTAEPKVTAQQCTWPETQYQVMHQVAPLIPTWAVSLTHISSIAQGAQVTALNEAAARLQCDLSESIRSLPPPQDSMAALNKKV